MAAPRTNHYNPKGFGSMLAMGDELIAKTVLYPYLDAENKVQYALGFVSISETELAALEQKLNSATSLESKQDLIDSFKSISFSSFFKEYVCPTPDNGTIKFKLDCKEFTDILDAIVVNATTTEQSYALAVDTAVTAKGRTKIAVIDTFVAVSAKGRNYVRAKKFEMR